MSPQLLARLAPDPERIDHDPAEARAAFDRLLAEGLHPREADLSPVDAYRWLAALAERSGALAFLALQLMVASASLGPGERTRVGVAFGHLRDPASRALCSDEAGALHGAVPWFTGAGIFDEAILGYREPDGTEVRRRVPAQDRPSFRHSAPLPLIAMIGANTVTVTVAGPPEGVEVSREPCAAMAERLRHDYVWQTPVMLGIARAAWTWIARAGYDTQVTQRHERRLEAEAREAERAILTGIDPAAGARLRARLAGHAIRLASLAAIAHGGGTLVRGHPIERLYREALVVSLMARTPALVIAALETDP